MAAGISVKQDDLVETEPPDDDEELEEEPTGFCCFRHSLAILKHVWHNIMFSSVGTEIANDDRTVLLRAITTDAQIKGGAESTSYRP